jgi:hypothetical protein
VHQAQDKAPNLAYFCVSVTEEDFRSVDNTEFDPTAVLLLHFFGRLNSDQIYSPGVSDIHVEKESSKLSSHRARVRVRVRVSLRLAVYRQSVRLGAKLLVTHDQRLFLQLKRCFHNPYITSSLTRRCVKIFIQSSSSYIQSSQTWRFLYIENRMY